MVPEALNYFGVVLGVVVGVVSLGDVGRRARRRFRRWRRERGQDGGDGGVVVVVWCWRWTSGWGLTSGDWQ